MAAIGSMLKVNGKSRAVPAKPPMPGRMPRTRPMRTPQQSINIVQGLNIKTKAFPAASSILTSMCLPSGPALSPELKALERPSPRLLIVAANKHARTTAVPDTIKEAMFK
jgi:hypothetical protein